MSRPPRLYLSPPHIGTQELEFVHQAFASNWLAPLGPHVDGFEEEMRAMLGCAYSLALSSGTAALHLALQVAGVKAGDEVWCSTLTFCASANPIRYLGATPAFIDSDEVTWNCDPLLLAQGLDEAARAGRLPRAVVVVDLFGQCADYDPILAACARHGVALIEDAAEAVGARYKGRWAGTLGTLGALSFNGNKIITTTGGGMLLGHDLEQMERARFLATQARDPAAWFQHSQLGYNYRLSNVLAGIGRGQLRVLEQRVAARRRVYALYRERLGGVAGLSLMPDHDFGHAGSRATHWLTVLQVDAAACGASAEDLRNVLGQADIEARPVWKPMHLQPLYAGCRSIGGAVAERLFERGLCLPSGSAMGEDDVDRVCDTIKGHLARSGPGVHRIGACR